MEAMRCLRRRLSDVVYRQLVADTQHAARQLEQAGPGVCGWRGSPGGAAGRSAAWWTVRTARSMVISWRPASRSTGRTRGRCRTGRRTVRCRRGCWPPPPQAGLTRLRPETGSLGGRDAEYLAAIAACAAAEGELARSRRWLVRGSARRPEVALTFDDGPHPVFTPRVLDILARYRIRATFFCVGLCAVAYPELVARIAEEGHHLGNHTWSHPYLPDLTRDELLRQVDTTGEVLGGIAGTVPVMMRPPYASRTPEVLRWLAGRHHRGGDHRRRARVDRAHARRGWRPDPDRRRPSRHRGGAPRPRTALGHRRPDRLTLPEPRWDIELAGRLGCSH
jgi:peptidoglycan/xylan/chitin deacetylase (PgdA/CDA1 family)